ncbi:MAG: hypothetical protein ABDH21_04355 [bacterium]
MNPETIKKFVNNSDDIMGLIIADREKEIFIEYYFKADKAVEEVNQICSAVIKTLKSYEATRTKSDLITLILNTNDFSIIADDYQDNNKVLIILFKPNYFVIKFVGKNAEYLKEIIQSIKSQ